MTQLYAIRAYGGEWDDSWEQVRFITDDEAKGQAYVDKMTALSERLREVQKELGTFHTEWQLANPAPKCRDAKHITVPKWDSKVTVTIEMRAERTRIEELNRADYQDAMKPYYDRCTASRLADEAKKATYSEEIQRGLANRDDDTFWDIGPVEWLE